MNRVPVGNIDDTTADLIDRTYDGAESFVRGVGRILGVNVDGPQAGEPVIACAATRAAALASHAQPHAQPAMALPAARVLALPAPAAAMWWIIPLRNERGEAVYAITDGRSGVLAPTRAAAEIVLAALTAQAAQAQVAA